MQQRATSMAYRGKWTKRAALLLSILYLSNPMYRPLQLVFHETLTFFESHDMAIGHSSDGFDSSHYFEGHEHESMELNYGHELIDLIGVVLNASEDEKSSDQSVPEIIKVDKHIPAIRFSLDMSSIHPISNEFFYPFEKYPLGHPIKAKEPPRLS